MAYKHLCQALSKQCSSARDVAPTRGQGDSRAGLTHFYKGPGSRHGGLCGPHGLCHSHPLCCCGEKASHRPYVNTQEWLHPNKTSETQSVGRIWPSCHLPAPGLGVWSSLNRYLRCCEPVTGASGERGPGNGVEKTTGARTETIFVAGQREEVLAG